MHAPPQCIPRFLLFAFSLAPSARRVLATALVLALAPGPLHAMTWSPFCAGGNWYVTCDVVDQNGCRRHNNWGQSVDCIVANPAFPGPEDDVQILSSATVTLAAAAANIASMTLMGQLTMYGHTMTIGSTAGIINGQFTVGAVTLAGAQPLELMGGESSRLQITNVSGFAGLELAGTEISNNGLIKWEAGTIGMSNGSVISNRRRFNLLGNNSVLHTGGAAGLIENQATGQMVKSSSGLSSFAEALQNDGLVQVQDGTLALLAGGSNSGYIELGVGTTLAIQGGTFTHTLGGFILGDGVVKVATGGTFAVNFPLAIDSFELSGGTVDGSQALQIDDIGLWNSGMMQGSGLTRVKSGATLTIPDTPQLKTLAGRTFDNQGLTQLAGIETIDLSLAAAVYNYGTFQILGDGGLTWNHGGAVPTVNNSGSFLKTGGTGTSPVDAAFNNTGLVEIQTGTLMCRSAHYTQTAGFTRLYGTTLRVPDGDARINGGTLTGNGTVFSFLLSNAGGTVAPGNSPGAITCTGDYTQTSSGKLDIEIGGLTPVSQHDVLVVTGNASLAGTIQLSIIGAFDPPIGSQFDVVTAASVNGTFGVIQKLGLPAGKDFQVSYPPGKVRVTIVARVVPAAGWHLIAALSAALAAAGAWAVRRAPRAGTLA